MKLGRPTAVNPLHLDLQGTFRFIKFIRHVLTCLSIQTLFIKSFAFLSTIEWLDPKELSFDVFDKFLKCIVLKWYQTLEEPGSLSVTKGFALLPCVNIRMRIHLVPEDTGTRFSQ